MLRISHIDKSIPHITFVLRKVNIAKVSPEIVLTVAIFYTKKKKVDLKINWEIDEIVGSTVVLINDSQKQLTVVPVDHIKYDLSQQKKKKIPE